MRLCSQFWINEAWVNLDVAGQLIALRICKVEDEKMIHGNLIVAQSTDQPTVAPTDQTQTATPEPVYTTGTTTTTNVTNTTTPDTNTWIIIGVIVVAVIVIIAVVLNRNRDTTTIVR